MKAICTFVLLFMSLGMAAQSNLLEFPYNPDADGNDIIGTADLMMLLSIFGDEFSEEGLYLSEDSTIALLYMGEHNFQSCSYTCSQLPGNWAITEFEELHLVMDDLSELLPPLIENTNSGRHLHTWVIAPDLKSRQYMDYYDHSYGGWELRDITEPTNVLFSEFRCYCSTRELPRVEYSYCWIHLDEVAEFDACVTEKVANGWYPFGGISLAGPEWTNSAAQAFWRWAD